MPLIHIVLFKLLPNTSPDQKHQAMAALKTLRSLSCVLNGHLVVGGPSVTDPIERSKGYDIALVSHHADRDALAAYQASEKHRQVTSTYVFPFKEDLIRFDFEVEGNEFMSMIPANIKEQL